jgi:hypothetical protein
MVANHLYMESNGVGPMDDCDKLDANEDDTRIE